MNQNNNLKLQLAALKESYKDQCYEIYLENNNFFHYAYSQPKSREKYDERFEDSETDNTFVLVDYTDQVYGFCAIQISTFDGWVDVDFMIREQYQNQGYGKTMVQMVIDQVKQLGSVEYFEAVTYDNPYSEKLLESLGFTKASYYPNYRRIIKDGSYVNLNKTGYYLKAK